MGVVNGDLIAWLREFEKEHPVSLRGCNSETIDIELQRPLDDLKTWAKKLIEFDSDICPRDDTRFFEKQLELSTRIPFWWD